MAELERFYEDASGGLALDALDLSPADRDEGELDAEYARQGFRRERHVFALRQDDRLKAVLSITLSDLGLNLSNLTNCVHAFVMDQEGTSPGTLMAGLRTLARHYRSEDLPVLVYPSEYADTSAMPYEKKYILWVLDTERSDGYFSSLHNTFRRTSRDRDDGQCSDD